MSNITPFFSITVSSSLFTSSKVKPYWNPEQPPPVTNTRSFNSELPSSSINCLTLFAALSVKTSGAGISATAFMSQLLLQTPLSGGVNRASELDGAAAPVFKRSLRPSDRGLARRELQLHRFCLARAVYQMPLDYGAEMHLQAVVMHVSFDPGARLEFEELGNVHGPRDLAVHHQVRYADFPFDTSLLAQHQGRRFVGNRSHVSDDFAVDTKASGEIDITLDLRADTNQAVDAILRLARLLAKHSAFCLLRKVDVLAGTGLARTALQDTRLYGPHPSSRRNPKCPLNRSEEHTSELQSLTNIACRLLLEKKKSNPTPADSRPPWGNTGWTRGAHLYRNAWSSGKSGTMESETLARFNATVVNYYQSLRWS